jgi:hypothetical protein
MGETITVMFVRSDNYNGMMTFEAYAEFRLQMSTGDFHTHTHEVITAWVDELLAGNVLTLEQLLEDQGA